MRNFPKILFLFTVFYLVSCSPTPKQAQEYNDMIVRQQRKVVDKLDNLIASFTTYNPQEMRHAYEILMKQINYSLDTLRRVKSFDGSTEFRDTTIKLLETYKQITENELKNVMLLLSKPQSQYTSEDAMKVSRLMLQAQDKFSTVNNNYKKYQEEFAKKYKLKLTLKQ